MTSITLTRPASHRAGGSLRGIAARLSPSDSAGPARHVQPTRRCPSCSRKQSLAPYAGGWALPWRRWRLHRVSQTRPGPRRRGEWDRALAWMLVPLLVASLAVLAIGVVISST